MKPETLAWMEAVAWWLLCADCFGYNLVAWAGKNWYESTFGKLARIFPVTKPFGMLYLVLLAWLGSALLRAGTPLFGST